MNGYSECMIKTESKMEAEGVWTGETKHNGTTPLMMSITVLAVTGVFSARKHRSVSPVPATPPSASRATTNNYISTQHDKDKIKPFLRN